ncbi:HAD family hydrolase [Verticiella sediminum]|uniref:Histidinol-phosphatase n=1 Tax=Verticiella sediminum TaxID=1247510 RepID=A0A556AQ28_9BURK|nr:HAD family hydrolase [Verticiella sediminum]TSH95012.1 HAD family hydrolase [Verticiella sediminum]
MPRPNRLALFDLDHTLLPLDSDYQWAHYLARTGRAGDPEAALRRNDELMESYSAGTLTAQQAAEFMLGLLARHDPVELAAWHELYMAEVIRPVITPQAAALVREHLAAGDLCAIVTATNGFVTAPIARAFGIPHLLATDAEYVDGRYTGRIAGTPCFREGKVIRVEQWLAGLGHTLADFERSFFYSDSLNDVPLLECVTDAVAANPSEGLRRLAGERGWRVIDLFAEPVAAGQAHPEQAA